MHLNYTALRASRRADRWLRKHAHIPGAQGRANRRVRPGLASRREQRLERMLVRRTGCAEHVWTGELAPWDERLGDFRGFTPEEIAGSSVCRSFDHTRLA